MGKFFVCYLVGGLVTISWSVLPAHGPWEQWDLAIFHTVNGWLGQSALWADVVAIVNNRLFDVVVLGCMGAILTRCFLVRDLAGRRQLIAMGIVMLLSALAINQLGHRLPVDRPSPTLMVADALRVTQISGIATKDSSGDSFPGDHALFLMIFAGYALRYLPRWASVTALLMVPIFSAPRILAGAHWFTDVYVGALGLATLCLPWLLLTPLADWLITRIATRLASIPLLRSQPR